MDFVVATLVFPLVVAALAVGAGLLVDAAAGRVLPGVLIPVFGLAALVVVAELFSYWEPIAPLGRFAVAAIAVAGYALGWRRLRRPSIDVWPVAAGAAAYVLVCLPILSSGRVTMTGYLLDTTTAFHLAGADYLTEHARNFARLPATSMRMTLEAYFGTGYPSGGHTLLGASGRLIGAERMWLYQPFLSLLVAACVPSLYFLARRAELSRPLAAGAALIAAVPALVYSYAQMGAIKELAALPFVLLLGTLVVMLPSLVENGLRGAVPAGVAAAAGMGAIGLAFVPWIGAVGVAALVVLLVRARWDVRALRPVIAFAAALAAITAVLALPTLGPLTESVSLAKSLSTSNEAAVADPGNLLRPLLGSQAAGIWLGGSHRSDPISRVDETFLLIGLVAVSALFGLAYLVRRRMWDLLGFAVALGVVWAALTYRGTTWTDAKLLVLSSSIVLLLAAFGVASLIRAGRKVEGAVIGALIAFGVLASNAFTYHDTNLAPTDRFQELIAIGDRFSGTSPTLAVDFDEYTFYAMPDMGIDGPGFASRSETVARLRDGVLGSYGQSFDVDALPLEAVQKYPLILVRRKPENSRPPANFDLAFRGRFWDVWRRTRSPRVVEHLPGGGVLAAASKLRCREVRDLARRARGDDTRLTYAVRPPLAVLEAAKAPVRPAGWALLPEGVGLYSPGELSGRVRLSVSGRYRVWLKGDFGRELSVFVGGRRIGGVSYSTGGAGNYGEPLVGEFPAGRNKVSVVRPGGSLRPGDGTPGRLVAVVFEPLDERPRMVDVPATEWRSACDRPVDWVERVRPG